MHYRENNYLPILLLMTLMCFLVVSCGAPSRKVSKTENFPYRVVTEEQASRIRSLPSPTREVVWSTHVVIGTFAAIERPKEEQHFGRRKLSIRIHEVLDGHKLPAGAVLTISEPLFPLSENTLASRQSGGRYVLFLIYDGCEYRLQDELHEPSGAEVLRIRELITSRSKLPETSWTKLHFRDLQRSAYCQY